MVQVERRSFERETLGFKVDEISGVWITVRAETFEGRFARQRNSDFVPIGLNVRKQEKREKKRRTGISDLKCDSKTNHEMPKYGGRCYLWNRDRSEVLGFPLGFACVRLSFDLSVHGGGVGGDADFGGSRRRRGWPLRSRRKNAWSTEEEGGDGG